MGNKMPRLIRSIGLLTAAWLACVSTSGFADPARLGPTFMVSTSSAGPQSLPSAVRLTDGGFVIVWGLSSFFGGGPRSPGIFGQRFNAVGSKVGNQFQLNSRFNVLGTISFKVAAAGIGDGFAGVWDYTSATGGGILMQRYDTAGARAGSNARVAFDGIIQSSMSAARLGDGGLIVTWSGQDVFAPTFTGDTEIWGQRYSSSGKEVGERWFQVNSVKAGYQSQPVVASLGSGGFVVVWGVDSSRVAGQVYAASGAPIGGEFTIRTATAPVGDFSPAVTGLANGGFVAAWVESDTSAAGVYAQRFSAAGTPVGAVFRVNNYLGNSQNGPSIAGLTEGGFVITWTSAIQDGSAEGVYGQAYTSASVPLGEFAVNSRKEGRQWHASVAPLADNSFVVTWASDAQEGFPFGIYAQRFRVQ